jgi:hypothetical protein
MLLGMMLVSSGEARFGVTFLLRCHWELQEVVVARVAHQGAEPNS